MCTSIYLSVVYVATFCLTQLESLDSVFMCLPLHVHTEEYTPSKCINCLVDDEFFFWHVYMVWL